MSTRLIQGFFSFPEGILILDDLPSIVIPSLHVFQNPSNSPLGLDSGFSPGSLRLTRFSPRAIMPSSYPCQGGLEKGPIGAFCLKGLQHTWLKGLEHGNGASAVETP